MRKRSLYISVLFLLVSCTFIACKDETKEILSDYPTDINFEDQSVDTLSFKIPDAPFKSGDAITGAVTVNVKKNSDGTFAGFAVSNKTMRSYPWLLSPTFGPSGGATAAQTKAAIDSAVFSVYTAPSPNQTKTYLVGCATNDDAFITLDKPAVVEHVLAANNTYNFLLNTYGSKYSSTLDAATQEYLLTGVVIRNINNPNTSTLAYGRFWLPGPGGVSVLRLEGEEILAKRAAGHVAADAARTAGKTAATISADSVAAYTALAKGFVKLTVKGFEGNKATGSVDFFLAVRPTVDPKNPAYNFVMNNWNKVDLTSLGTVTKLVFNVTSSNPNIPPYFCLDGLRIRK